MSASTQLDRPPFGHSIDESCGMRGSSAAPGPPNTPTDRYALARPRAAPRTAWLPNLGAKVEFCWSMRGEPAWAVTKSWGRALLRFQFGNLASPTLISARSYHRLRSTAAPRRQVRTVSVQASSLRCIAAPALDRPQSALGRRLVLPRRCDCGLSMTQLD